MEIEALIAGGGLAKRLGPLPCSKEIFPLTGQYVNSRIKVVCENLIEYYRLANITNIHFVIRKGKWDIPGLLGDGSDYGVHIVYHIMKLSYGTPFTLDQAFPFIQGKYIAMGFPDIIMEPANAFQVLKLKMMETEADMVLGIFPVKTYRTWDMVEFEGNKIKDIVIKGTRSDLKYGWTNVIWSPAFTRFLHAYLEDTISSNEEGTIKLPDGSERELYVGDVLLAAMKSGLSMDYVIFENGVSKDIGTPDDMIEYIRSIGQ